jgi:hypothetical protein
LRIPRTLQNWRTPSALMEMSRSANHEAIFRQGQLADRISVTSRRHGSTQLTRGGRWISKGIGL